MSYCRSVEAVLRFKGLTRCRSFGMHPCAARPGDSRAAMTDESSDSPRLTIRVAGRDADPREVDELTRQLLLEIRRGTDVLSAGLARSGPAPARAKSGDLVQSGVIVFNALAPALPGLVGMLRGWSGRRTRGTGPGVNLTLTVDNRSVHFECPVDSMSHDDLMNMIGIVENGPPGAQRTHRVRRTDQRS